MNRYGWLLSAGLLWVVVDRVEAEFMLVEWPNGAVTPVPWAVVDPLVKEGDRLQVTFVSRAEVMKQKANDLTLARPQCR